MSYALRSSNPIPLQTSKIARSQEVPREAAQPLVVRFALPYSHHDYDSILVLGIISFRVDTNVLNFNTVQIRYQGAAGNLIPTGVC